MNGLLLEAVPAYTGQKAPRTGQSAVPGLLQTGEREIGRESGVHVFGAEITLSMGRIYELHTESTANQTLLAVNMSCRCDNKCALFCLKVLLKVLFMLNLAYHLELALQHYYYISSNFLTLFSIYSVLFERRN